MRHFFPTFNHIANIFTLSVLFSFALYHLFIFLGRRKLNNEKYNLYFSVFSFSQFAIVLSYSLHELSRGQIKYDEYAFSPLTTVLLALVALISAVGFISYAYEIKGNFHKRFLSTYVLMGAAIIPAAMRLFNSIDDYMSYYFPAAISLAFISIVVMLFILIKEVIGRKKYKLKGNYLLSAVVLAMTAYIILDHVLWLFNVELLPGNYIWVGVFILFASYALSVKFNNEYTELDHLRNNLSQQVLKRTAELEAALEKIEILNREKNKIYARAAHETKTPLTLIKNYFDRYIRKHKKQNDNELTIVQKNINLLVEDINTLMDVEKIEQQAAVYNHDQLCDLSRLLMEKEVLFKEYARARNIELVCHLQKDLSVKADPLSLQRIIYNLFENAVKYSKENSQITIKTYFCDSRVMLQVEDQGIGISRENLPSIFNLYKQEDMSAEKPGIGIGLYVVKEIADELKGSVSVTSEEGKGSIFTVSLPGYENNSESNSVQNIQYVQPEEIQDTMNASVLIVEDDSDLRNYLVEELTPIYRIYAAENGMHAMDILNKHTIDLIVSDIMMPEVDGISLFKWIKENPEFHNTAFMFITARSSKIERINMLNAGATDYISKPFDSDDLKARIQGLLLTLSKQRNALLNSAIESVKQSFAAPNQKIKNESLSTLFEKHQLTARQKEIVELLHHGYEYKEIANQLNISTKTIDRHIQILYRKMEVNNKLELIKIFYH